MKKRLLLIFALTGLLWLGALGCSNNNIDTAKVRAAFQSLSGDSKNYLDLACQAIDQSNYVAAVKPLKNIAITAKLNKDQSLLLKDTLDKVEAKAAKQK